MGWPSRWATASPTSSPSAALALSSMASQRPSLRAPRRALCCHSKSAAGERQVFQFFVPYFRVDGQFVCQFREFVVEDIQWVLPPSVLRAKKKKKILGVFTPAFFKKKKKKKKKK